MTLIAISCYAAFCFYILNVFLELGLDIFIVAPYIFGNNLLHTNECTVIL